MKTPAVKVHLSHCVVSVNKPGRQMGCGTDQWGKKLFRDLCLSSGGSKLSRIRIRNRHWNLVPAGETLHVVK